MAGLLVICALGPGCGETTLAPDLPGSLVDVRRWREVSALEDPFTDRPEPFSCRPGGHHPEGEVYEIETDRCAYVTVVQPSARTVLAGQRIRVVFWHQTLLAEGPAEAHMAVRLGPHVVAETRAALPQPPRLYMQEWPAPNDLPAGTSVYLHAHNHGANSYRFGTIELLAP